MFEVEQKFLLSDEEIIRLVEGADFLGEKKFTDEYFDTGDYNLTKNDIWLRKRGESFELKIPVFQNQESPTNQYQEVEGEEKIREIFAIPKRGNFLEDISEMGYGCFCRCETVRKKYKKKEFTIDLDEVSYDLSDLRYTIAEIELLVEKTEEIRKAQNDILEFAKKLGFRVSNIRGKVVEYLKNEKPDHYQALQISGVIKK